MMQNAELVAISGDQTMTRCGYATLLFLTGIADDEGVAVATLDQIADHTGFDRSQTAKTVKALEGMGRLVRKRRHPDDERPMRAVYEIPRRVCTPAFVGAR